MKRFIPLFALFLMSFQLSASNGTDGTVMVDSICDVSITIDSTAAGDFILTAEPTGTAPFTYAWSNGETTQDIIPIAVDTGYCVTVVDADGCEAWACFWDFPQSCGLAISANPTGGLTAVAFGTAPFTYLWNSGATTQTVNPTDPGYYCVSAIDSEGCTAYQCYWYAGNPDSCNVTIFPDSSIIGSGEIYLYAASTGTGPFTYQWDFQNATTSSVQVPTSGNYCVTITSATGCTASNCIDINDIECSTAIFEGWNGLLYASADGLFPLTYEWSNGDTEYSIQPTEPGEYCVTITALNGCTSSDCLTVDSVACGLYISLYQGDSSGVTIIDAIATGAGPLTYLWSTGETTQYIDPTVEGEYCVTVTAANGCSETACVNFDLNLQIQGWVYLPDSLDPVFWDGFAELYQFDADGNLSLHSTIDIATDPSGYYAYYDFGDVDPGSYLVKAGINADEPISGEYMPTYYGDELEWDLATTINVPVGQWYYNITLIQGEMLLEGGGEINGLIVEGSEFKGGDDTDRDPEDPIAGVSILLFDEMENPLTHTLTNISGEYSFGNLPFGTYKIMVEIAGKEQAERWVTLSDGQPIASGIDFDVNSGSIVNGVAEWVGEQGFAVFPNPTGGQLFLDLHSTRQFEGQLSLTSLTGATVLAQPKNIAIGGQRLALDIAHLPAGVYFLQLTTGNEVLSRKVVKD